MRHFISRFRSVHLPLALAALLALSFAAAATACPTCKDGLGAHDPHYQSLAAGFNYSILFMLSMPYLILGSFGFMAFTSIKRAKARHEAAAASGESLADDVR